MAPVWVHKGDKNKKISFGTLQGLLLCLPQCYMPSTQKCGRIVYWVKSTRLWLFARTTWESRFGLEREVGKWKVCRSNPVLRTCASFKILPTSKQTQSSTQTIIPASTLHSELIKKLVLQELLSLSRPAIQIVRFLWVSRAVWEVIRVQGTRNNILWVHPVSGST